MGDSGVSTVQDVHARELLGQAPNQVEAGIPGE